MKSNIENVLFQFVLWALLGVSVAYVFTDYLVH